MDFENIHISELRAGDTIQHGEKLMTVCNNDLTNIAGMGRAVFGDTYKIGTKPVSRAKLRK